MTHYVIVLTAISIIAVGCAAQARLPNRAASALHAQLEDDWKCWMTAETRADYEAIILRLQRVPTLVDQTVDLMEQGLAAKMTPPRITFHEVPGQVMAQIFDDPMKSPLLEVFSKMPASISEADHTNLKNRAARTYKEAVVPAFTKFHQFLISRYLPACREATSAAALPNGAEMYEYNVKWHAT